jgi:hypothetical protein
MSEASGILSPKGPLLTAVDLLQGVLRVGGPDSERRLGIGGVAQLLGVPRLTVWWWAKTGQLRPMNMDGDAPWWSPLQAYEWALDREKPRLSGRVPLTVWPDASARRAPVYSGAVDLQGAVATRWTTSAGPVALVWPLTGGHRRSNTAWAKEAAPDSDGAVVVVTSLIHQGPDIDAVLPGLPDGAEYALLWSDVARVLGSPVPFWPQGLRIRELIHAWRPQMAPVTALAVSDLDTSVLLQLAATYEQGHPHAQVLLQRAQRTNRMAYEGAADHLQRIDQSPGFDPQHLVVAARPLPVPDVDDEALPQLQRRAAWADILQRGDDLAARAVKIVEALDGGADFPASNPQEVDPRHSRWAKEWSDRLQPCAPTAAHVLLDEDGETLTDPETDVPAVRADDGTLSAAMPQRLPARAPLKELILDRDAMIWVRTDDGVLYPAPRDSYYGLNWGYNGSGPGTLALLIEALLDDITAKAPADINGAADGLQKLTRTKLPRSTVLTRRDLENARAGRWLPVFTTDTDDQDDVDDEDGIEDRDDQ